MTNICQKCGTNGGPGATACHECGDTRFYGDRFDQPVIHVRHAQLKRTTGTSMFRSECLKCRNGILLFRREQSYPYRLIPEDNCIVCGQRYYYVDIEEVKALAGENE